MKKNNIRAIIVLIFVLMSLAVSYATQPAGLFYVQQDNKYGFIDQTGKIVIQPQFDNAGNFVEGLAKVRLDGKLGFIDTTGKMVIEPQYIYTGNFSEGLALIAIKSEGNYGFIDKTGKIVINPIFEDAEDFSGGFSMVCIDQKYGFIDPFGKIVINAEYDFAKSFSEGMALVKTGEQYWFINTKGDKVIKVQGDGGRSFAEGLAAIEVDEKFGFIDKTGKWAIEPQFNDVRDFCNGLAGVKSGEKWGYIDHTGSFVIEPQYFSLLDFTEDLAAVAIDGKYGFIDPAGKMVIAPQYDTAESFKNGLSRVSVIGIPGYSYINSSGEYVWTTALVIQQDTVDFNNPRLRYSFDISENWEIKKGTLNFLGGDKNMFYWNLYGQKVYSDFQCEVKANWTGGKKDDGFGLFFHYVDNQYYFGISANGSFCLLKWDSEWQELIPWKKNSLIKIGPNKLKISCHGEIVHLFINGTMVADLAIPGLGKGYFDTGVSSSGSVRCSFDDFTVSRLTAADNSVFNNEHLERNIDFSDKNPGFYVKKPWQLKNNELNFTGADKKLYYPNIAFDEYGNNFTVSVNTKWNNGSGDSGFGLIFRYKDNKNYYDFEISKSGYFLISKKKDGTWEDFRDWTKTNFLNPGMNRLTVTCKGASIQCFINDNLVADIHDEDPGTGFISVGVCANGDVKCSFDDFFIQELATPASTGKIIDFSSDDTGFKENDNFEISNGELHFNSAARDTIFSNTYTSELSYDATISVKTLWNGGNEDKGYGLIFHYQDINNYYFFQITANGYYKLSKSVPGGWKVLSPWQRSGLINEKANLLKVACNGRKIKCYINEQPVIELDDELPDGEKLSAGVGSNSEVECSFDDFTIHE